MKTVSGSTRTGVPSDYIIKRRKSDSDGSMAGENAKDVEMQDRSPDKYMTTEQADIEINLSDTEPAQPKPLQPKPSRMNPLASKK